MKPSLGETLADLPGVSASSFGPSASRPILRGLSGERRRPGRRHQQPRPVRLRSRPRGHHQSADGRADRGASRAGRCFTARRRSAASSTSSTPASRAAADDRSRPTLMLNFGSAANERRAISSWMCPSAGISSPTPTAPIRSTTTFTSAASPVGAAARAEALASPIPTIRALAGSRTSFPTPPAASTTSPAGLAYVDGDLNIGVSYSHHDVNYGVPIRFSLDPRSRRSADHRRAPGLAATSAPTCRSAASSSCSSFAAAFRKYHHDELEPDGAIGSSFFTDGGELRADLVQTERSGWGGTSGVQYLDQDARIRGDEKYLPDSRERQLGFFTLQSLVRGPLRFEGGARVESAIVSRRRRSQIAANGGPVGASPISPQLHARLGVARRQLRVRRGWRAGPVAVAQRARALDPRAVRQRRARRQRSSFWSATRPRHRSEQRRRAQRPPHDRAGPRPGQRLLQPLRQLHFPGADRRQSATACPNIAFARARPTITVSRLERRRQVRHRRCGIDWGGELIADAVRATIEVTARRRRSRRCACSAA